MINWPKSTYDELVKLHLQRLSLNQLKKFWDNFVYTELRTLNLWWVGLMQPMRGKNNSTCRWLVCLIQSKKGDLIQPMMGLPNSTHGKVLFPKINSWRGRSTQPVTSLGGGGAASNSFLTFTTLFFKNTVVAVKEENPPVFKSGPVCNKKCSLPLG